LARQLGRDKGLLLQYLIAIQQHFSYIPAGAMEQLAQALELPLAQVRAVVDFYAFLYEQPRGDFNVLFSDSITDHMLGSRELMQQLCQQLGAAPGQLRDDDRVTVDTASCTGMCDQGPAMLVNGRAVTRLDADRIEQIADLIEQGKPVRQWPAEMFSVADNIQRRDLLLDEPMTPGASLERLLELGGHDLLNELELSGLRGRGGAGFSTATKWKICRKTRADQRYVVCNADEGEPGTFKDRVLLQRYADEVIEGMTACAGIINASRGFIYLRGEYLYLLDHLNEVIQRRRDARLLGNGILGRAGFDFDIDIHLGAGAYICGEESGLLKSLEGKRGVPRRRPPFPVTSGYREQPTIVNNVETLLAAAKILLHGSDWYRSRGTSQSSGTKILSISGDCQQPGIYEYPMGVTIAQVLEDCGGADAQAVQISGAAGHMVPASEFNRAIAFEDLSTAGSFMVFGPQRDMLDTVRNFAHFFVHESCGFCTPCRVGGALLCNLVDKLHSGHASDYDISEMRTISEVMQSASHCGLGHTAPNALLDLLDKFPDSYRSRLKHTDFEPAFDLDAALAEARELTGRDDASAHLE
jgi:[NiFe] hydrogenase diaphorase moiety large subunit